MGRPFKSAPTPTYDRLTDRQKIFVDQYIGRWNASYAARKAGYKDFGNQGFYLKRQAEIRQAISEVCAARGLSKNEVFERLCDQATGTIDDFIRVRRRVAPDGTEHVTNQISLDKARRKGKLHLIKKIKWGPFGPSIELCSQTDALKLIGQAHGMFDDRNEEKFSKMLEALVERLRARLPADVLEQALAAIAAPDGGEAPDPSSDG